MSDFYKLVISVMKTCFRKMKLKTTRYRSYKNFNNYAFFVKKLMCGDSNWRLEEFTSQLHQSGNSFENSLGKGKSSSLYEQNNK